MAFPRSYGEEHEGIAIVRGVVHALDLEAGPATAVLCRGGRIVLVGDDDSVLSASGPGDLRLDAMGGAVLPGFVDSHVRLLDYCLSLRRLDLQGTRSVEDCVQRIREHASKARKETWILGRGWSKDDWIRPELPTKEDLDRAVPDRPAAFWSRDGHMLWANTAALRATRVTKDSPVPVGGEMTRDPETLEPAGVFKGSAVSLVSGGIGLPPREDIIDALKEGIDICLSRGIVAVHGFETTEGFDALQVMALEGSLKIGVYVYLPETCLGPAKRLKLRGGFGCWPLRLMGIEANADGSLGSQTAFLLEPYEGRPNYRGIEVLKKDDLEKLAREASECGLSFAVHAIGDGAARNVLDAFAAVGKMSFGPRHRIEHAQLVHPKDLPRIRQLGMIASVQPSHAITDKDLAVAHWGPRSKHAYGYRSMADSGIIMAFGSDAPVEDLDPLKGIHAAVTRRNPGDEPWIPSERLTVKEAVTAFTLGAAYAVGLEDRRGTITPGKAADLVVLDQDIMGLEDDDHDRILEAKVMHTIINGRLQYTTGKSEDGRL